MLKAAARSLLSVIVFLREAFSCEVLTVAAPGTACLVVVACAAAALATLMARAATEGTRTA
jgi:hypothetical protein